MAWGVRRRGGGTVGGKGKRGSVGRRRADGGRNEAHPTEREREREEDVESEEEEEERACETERKRRRRKVEGVGGRGRGKVGKGRKVRETAMAVVVEEE